MAEKIPVLVWGENVHERNNTIVARIYPNGTHHCIAEGLHEKAAFTVETATLQDDEHGLTEAGWHKPMCSSCGTTPRTAK